MYIELQLKHKDGQEKTIKIDHVNPYIALLSFAQKLISFKNKEQWKIVKIKTDNLMIINYFEKHEPSIPIQFDIENIEA